MPRVDTTITFSDSDLEGCQHPHDDPLVVRAIVANTTVHRVLVDNGSSADIIFASAFDKMGIGREKLEPVSTHLRGFSGERVLPLGSIQLVLTLGEPPCQATTTTRFLIVDAPSAYNMLLGRPSLQCSLTSSPLNTDGRAPTIYNDEPFPAFQTDGLLPTILIDELSPQHRRTSSYYSQ